MDLDLGMECKGFKQPSVHMFIRQSGMRGLEMVTENRGCAG